MLVEQLLNLLLANSADELSIAKTGSIINLQKLINAGEYNHS